MKKTTARGLMAIIIGAAGGAAYCIAREIAKHKLKKQISDEQERIDSAAEDFEEPEFKNETEETEVKNETEETGE